MWFWVEYLVKLACVYLCRYIFDTILTSMAFNYLVLKKCYGVLECYFGNIARPNICTIIQLVSTGRLL